MSVYTTELRYICEHDSGLTESVGLSQIDTVITACARSLFGSYPIFDETYRPTLEAMIIKHYYMWEIGAETAGLFKLWLNERMNEIMPKYNVMYSALDYIKQLENPFIDTDVQTTHSGQDDTVGSSVSSSHAQEQENSSRAETESGSKREDEKGSSDSATNNSSSSRQENTTDHLNKYADTPQGGLSGLLNDTYLTNATKDDGTDTANTTASAASANSSSDSRERTGSDNRSRSGADSRDSTSADQRNDSNAVMTTREYAERVIGKRGGASLIKEYNELCEQLQSIDMMIIRDLQDLFMGVW